MKCLAVARVTRHEESGQLRPVRREEAPAPAEAGSELASDRSSAWPGNAVEES